MPKILSQTDMQSLLSMAEVIDAVEDGFRSCASGDYRIPVRLPLDVPDRDAVVLYMPAYLPRSDGLGAKVVSVFPHNPAAGRPAVTGFYLLCNAGTGELLALMDATYMTGLRTAAASAVASKYLARPDARVLGIFGAGVQARHHVQAITIVFPIERVMVFNRTPERGRALIKEIKRRYGVDAHLAFDPEACARASDIIATCTASPQPIVRGAALRPGAHVNAVGAYKPDMRELDTAAIRGATVVVDTYEGALAEAGDILIPIREGAYRREDIYAELAEVVSGKKAGRTSEDQITVFKSVGFAMEDVVTAKLAYESALTKGVGHDVPL